MQGSPPSTGSTRSSTRWMRNTMLPPPPRGIGIERLRDPPTEWSRQFEALGRIIAAPAQDPELLRCKARSTAATALGLRAQTRPPGTEFLDAETGCQKSPLRRANAHRDKDLRNEWPEIPAETPYLASYRKRAVCGDWMVEVVGHKLKTHHPVIEPVSDIRVGNGIFRCRDGGSRSAFLSCRD